VKGCIEEYCKILALSPQRKLPWHECKLPWVKEDKAANVEIIQGFRFNDPATGAPQISDFADSDPSGDTPLEIRMKHFTEIENFTFMGFVLAHELGGNKPKPISTMTGLQVPDQEFQNLVNLARTDNLTDEDLGDTLLDVGINWSTSLRQQTIF